MGLDVGADDVDNDIYQALHGVYSGQLCCRNTVEASANL